MAYIAEAFNTAVMRNPACTSPDTKVIEAMTAMSRISEAHANCIVVVEHEQVVGLLTERDMLRLAIQQLPVEHLTLRQVLKHPPVTIRESALNDLSTVLNLFEQLQVSHLPIVDDSDRLVGLISNSSLHQILSSIALQQAKEQEQSQTDLFRQQSEARFRASEQRYVSLVAASPVGIIHTDLEGICTYANERYCEIIGIESAKLIGQLWSQGHTTDNLERINQEFERSLRENCPFHLEYSIQRPDGAEVWVYGQAVVEYDAEGQKIGYIGTATDISDRKLAESLLASQHKILERIAKAEPLSDIFETLLQTMESYLMGAICSITLCRDGQLCHVAAPSLPQNYAAALAEADLPIAEGVGSCGTAAFRRELVIVSDIENDPLWRNYKSFVQDYGLQACASIPIFASDQTVLGVFGIYYREKKTPQSQELEWIAQAANIAGIAIERQQATQSLTQLNQTLESIVEERTAALQMSEERWQLALKGSNAGIWDWDITGNKKFYSTRWKEMRGFAEDEISDLVDECESRVHPDDYDRIFAQLNAHLAGETEFCELEYRTRCKDGSYIWIADRGQALRDATGQAIRMIGSDTDITARKQAEIALQESERRYSTLAAAAPVAIFRFDKQLNCTYVNHRWCEMTGRSAESALGRGWMNALHPDDLNHALEELNYLHEHASPDSQFLKNGEGRHLRPDGTINWFYSQVVQEFDEAGNLIGFVGTLTDISDRKVAEQELILKQNHLQALLNNIPYIAWIKDEQSRFIAVNQPFAQSCGIAVDEIVGKTDYDIWPADLAQAYRDDDAQVLQSFQRKVVEERVALADGTLGWIETTKTPFRDARQVLAGTVGIAVDITNRKTMELALRESERRYASLVAASPVAIFRFDTPMHCVYVNERWSALSGRPMEAALGYGWMESLHPDDSEQSIAEWTEYYTQSGDGDFDIRGSEGRHLRLDGTTTWCYIQVAKEFDDDGNVIGYVGTLTDITERKTTEIALQESETKFKRITESVPGMIYRYVLHPDGSDECTYVSPQVRQFFELEPDIVLQSVSHLWERVHPDDMPITLEEVKVSAESLNPFFIEERLILPQAGLKWVQIMARPERHKNGDIVWDGVVLDITDRKKLEQEQTKLTTILEATPDYIGMVNAQGEILWHNKQLRKLRPEIGDPKDHRFVTECHPDWVNKIIAEQALPIAIQEGSWSGELALLDGKGGEIPVSQVIIAHKSADGIVENFSTIMRDISDRKQAEIALNRELLRRSTIFNTSPDGIHVLDKDGNLIEANERFFKMLGYTSVEALQLNVVDWDAQWNQEELQSIFQNFKWNLSQAWVFETLHRRKDGSVFPVEISECPMEWNGELAVVCLSRDISDRKQAEAQLQRTNQELIRATRLKDEFLANMSHELRTPLNAILGMSEALQEMIFGSLNDKQISFLKTIEDSGNHLLNLINDILDVAKIESGQIELDFQPTDICSLCNSSMAFIKQQALKKSIQIRTNITPQLPKLLVDERRILQVLINLLNNAVKFTLEGGQITLEASHHQYNGKREPLGSRNTANEHHNLITQELVPTTLQTRGYIKIAITDTGIGIAPEDMTRLFQPFIQLDSALNRQYTGTGLGLALVKEITELHGGVVNLTSEVGVGSCFSIELPCEPVSSILETTSTSEHSNQPHSSIPDKAEVSHLILLAEDNEANISTIVGYLEIYGYRFIIANNGLEAIALSQAEHPDIILMDIQMPIMDGIEAIQQIRQDSQFQNTPIIALTALAMNGDEERCLSAGATSYLSKPVKLRQLNELIRQLIGAS